MNKEEIIEIYENRESIEKFIEILKKYKFEDFIKTDHFYYSIEEKNTNINFIIETYSKFSLISLIVKRKHRNDKISYDFYYQLNDGSYIIYAIALDEIKPVILNAFKINRNFKKFRKHLIRAYKNKIIG